mmetsp:Transcript_20143/g.44449  ORF Transcript_20143/g.44449 Transcript_20143/m.44449 type:complete len:237 (+) Transcript_20143:149-859(+)
MASWTNDAGPRRRSTPGCNARNPRRTNAWKVPGTTLLRFKPTQTATIATGIVACQEMLAPALRLQRFREARLWDVKPLDHPRFCRVLCDILPSEPLRSRSTAFPISSWKIRRVWCTLTSLALTNPRAMLREEVGQRNRITESQHRGHEGRLHRLLGSLPPRCCSRSMPNCCSSCWQHRRRRRSWESPRNTSGSYRCSHPCIRGHPLCSRPCIRRLRSLRNWHHSWERTCRSCCCRR